MPRGFIGMHAVRYLGQTTEAHRTAINSGNQTSQETQARMIAQTDGQTNQMFEENINTRERQLPFSPEDATTGSFTTGRRNSTNIVADEHEYNIICQRVSQTDDQISECMYKIAQEIETLCQTSFILPVAVPRCMNVSNDVKSSLSQFREVTDEIILQTRRFAREITSIGG